MEGHVRKQANGRWYAALELSRDPVTGARRRRSLGGYATRAEAREALQGALEQARRGWQGPDRVTVAEFLAEWLDGVQLELSPTTAGLYRTLMEHHVIPRIGGERLQQLTPAAITKLYAELLAGGGPGGRALSPVSVRNIHSTLRKALGDAVAGRRLDWNPATAAKVPRVERDADLRVWTADEVGRFLAHIQDDRLGPLYILAATSGARRAELLGLRWVDLGLDATPPVMRIRRTLVQYGTVMAEKEPKTPRSRRTVALDAAAVAALRRHRITQAEERLIAGPAYANDDRVFADEIGRPLNPGNVSRGFSRRVKSAGLPPLTLHGLRHTFATLGLEAGVDTLYLSEILGHSSVSITAGIYQHTREERLVGAVQRVGDAIFGRHEAH